MIYIAIEGPIGVGKTVLTRLLGITTLFEQFEENPFPKCFTLYSTYVQIDLS